MNFYFSFWHFRSVKLQFSIQPKQSMFTLGSESEGKHCVEYHFEKIRLRPNTIKSAYLLFIYFLLVLYIIIYLSVLFNQFNFPLHKKIIKHEMHY